jgi:hypothetical protein
MASKKLARGKRARKTKQPARAASKKRRSGARTGDYRGALVLARRSARTKTGEPIKRGQVLLAVGDALDGDWVPVIYQGRVELVQMADLSRVQSAPKR